MIDFSDIDKYSWKYDLYNSYLRFNHNHVYYKEYRVMNQENIPKEGVPTFIIGNHQNGLTDALTLLYMFPDKRQPVFIARGDIFKNNIVARLLHFLKILPSFRNRDGDRSDVRANSGVFNIAAHVLNRGGTLVMFPEASHQAGHYVGDFKKGFPRIAFAAEELADYKLGLQIVPVNIHYSDYYNFRSKAILTVGEPFPIDSLFELYQSEPNAAYLALNAMAREKIKTLTMDEDKEYFHEYDQLREILHRQRIINNGKNPDDLYEERLEDMKIVDELNQLKIDNNEHFTVLMELAREYTKGLKKLNLKNWLIDRKVTLSQLLGKSFLLLLTFPFYLFGLINNFLPFYFSTFLKSKIKDRQLHSSMNFAPGVNLSFPLMYIIILILAWVISGRFWVALVYLLAAFLSLFIYYSYKKSFVKLKASWRYYSLNKKKNPLLSRLTQIKRKIIADGI